MMTNEGPNDAELIKRFSSGDDESFEILVNRYRSRVERLAYRFTRDKPDAEEIRQEVFLTVYRKISQFEGKSSFSTWLYRITVNASLMKLRGKSPSEVSSMEEMKSSIQNERSDRYPDPDKNIITEEVLNQIEKAMGKMPDDFKTIIVLRDIENFSNEETAEIMDISVAAVKSRLHRARLYLREKLKNLYEETIESG
jgi:RNA polymerase sigma-70 factor, ECF subfamily